MANWNQTWNQAWNAGFNRPGVDLAFPEREAPGYIQGFSAGQAEFNKRQRPGGTTGGAAYAAGIDPNSFPSMGSNQAPSAQPTQNFTDLGSASRSAAQDAYSAENQSLNTQFDYAAAQMQNQLGTLGTEKDRSLAGIDLGLGNIQNQVGTSKTNLQTNTGQQIKEAGSTARNVQGQNRNVLRALGILNSSAAGQILAKPLNQFDEQRAQLGQFMVQKTTELDQFVNQAVKEAEQQKGTIVEQYNKLVGNIQTDLRFNDRQRNDAIKSANAALSQRMAEISQAVMSYQQQAEQQKLQFAQSMAAALNYQAPQWNQQASGYQTLANATQGTQSANIAGTQQRKYNPLTGQYE